jgi:hypothetical protein
MQVDKQPTNHGERIIARSTDIGELFIYMAEYMKSYPPNPYDTTGKFSCDTYKGEWILTLERWNAN